AQPEPLQEEDGVIRQAQRFDRQITERFLHAVRGGDGETFRPKAGKPGERRSCGDAVGKAGSYGQPEGTQSADEIGHQLVLASEEMGHAGDVDPKSVFAFDVSGWTIAAAPARQGEK